MDLKAFFKQAQMTASNPHVDPPEPPTYRCSTCGKPGKPPHTCPYKEDINDDNLTMCNCCDDCTGACADDI